ncbi:hypothetical protein, variant [Aphanomyces invadans]|uniref:Uncharacterized protein n=2 Tax=Aphanomyces invadans TaxID=157072 RepID=A0A024TLT5_9STRA|nr:hypothetical protein, variant [Aphanomyces invadans]ETV94596.1 hypothetical protein, variant [Aphanomyces invadans]|eukprot:XP_008876911.1 hypothetical protein, variant [Aphanomyces invadans]
MSTKNAKRQWDQTMASSGVVAPGSGHVPRKRFSGRTMKISKTMKHVDEETRRQVRNARLDALEADNYMENTDDGDEDMFVLDEDDDAVAKKASKPKSKAKAKGTLHVPQAQGRHRVVRKIKSLRHLIFEEVSPMCYFRCSSCALVVRGCRTRE